jgi:hypothetical protein
VTVDGTVGCSRVTVPSDTAACIGASISEEETRPAAVG